LISNQKDGYNMMNRSDSGLYLEGNVKDLVWLKSSTNEELLLTATNNNSIIINSLNN
jgi:hypothetical protein